MKNIIFILTILLMFDHLSFAGTEKANSFIKMIHVRRLTLIFLNFL
ncbi:MAG: hypothetical protein IPF75_16205 [Bacteroidetes bacterium]|nr:hypothetical protein [Bacteroidota bacterium]